MGACPHGRTAKRWRPAIRGASRPIGLRGAAPGATHPRLPRAPWPSAFEAVQSDVYVRECVCVRASVCSLTYST